MDAATKLMKLGSKALNVTPSIHNPTLITWVDNLSLVKQETSRIKKNINTN
jgi:hypothetical protein